MARQIKCKLAFPVRLTLNDAKKTLIVVTEMADGRLVAEGEFSILDGLQEAAAKNSVARLIKAA